MVREQIFTLIATTLNAYLRNSGSSEVEVTIDTRLLGKKAPIDSLGLVNVLLDLETALRSCNVKVSFLSDQAMSMERSPFLTVSTLLDFIEAQK
ncbi:hypothetical protein SDC9_107638 [bioreactor metagenome]|uniref:Carrier domain-containing protein n=1 Tax=bioreactor metagenome TaxID=1076179 RepID=A0A645BGE1_9ZZZZ